MKRLLLLLILTVISVDCTSQVKDYSVRILETYPHDRNAYTQGLFFWQGKMYETTGEYGRSSIRRVDYVTGVPEEKRKFTDKYFAEGSSVVDGKMYILTWRNNQVFVYDAVTLKYEKTFSYPREGWGLTVVPADWKEVKDAVMVASDGSDNLFFLDKQLHTLKTLKVTYDGRPLRLLNELEWIEGRIWANIYTTDMIVMIDPSSGKVTGRVDCGNLIPKSRRTPSMDVLNGIAFDGKDVFLTGKDWPSLFKVKVE